MRGRAQLQPFQRQGRGQGDLHRQRHRRQIKFLSIDYKDPTIKVVGPAAIVRFHWVAEQEMAADGKKVPTNLHILMNWQKQGDEWKLLSRRCDEVVIDACPLAGSPPKGAVASSIGGNFSH